MFTLELDPGMPRQVVNKIVFASVDFAANMAI